MAEKTNTLNSRKLPIAQLISCGDISCELLVDPIPRPAPEPITVTAQAQAVARGFD